MEEVWLIWKNTIIAHVRQAWSLNPAESFPNHWTSVFMCEWLNFTEMPENISNITCVKDLAEVDAH